MPNNVKDKCEDILIDRHVVVFPPSQQDSF